MYGPCLRSHLPRATYWRNRFAMTPKCLTERKGTMIKSKPSKPAPQLTDTMTIGLDIGYGVVKVITPTGITLLFPSVYGLAREIKFRAEEIAAKFTGDQISDDEGDWWVGDLALQQMPSSELLRLRGRTADQEQAGHAFRLRLAKVAIGKIFAGHRNGDVFHVRIATGLPVDHMWDAASLKQAFIGQHQIRTDSTDIVVNITDVIVMPQPYGSLYSAMLNDDGSVNPAHTAEETGIVDAGTYTVDVTLDRAGMYIDAASGSAESGVYTAQERIATLLERDLREKPSLRAVETVLRTGQLKVRGKTINYDAKVAEALEPLRRTTINLMNEKWRGATEIDVIYLSGGGATLVEDEIKALYPHAVTIENSQTANARGYLNYAMAAERRAGR
jgi:plasmid segregation protein ParM